MDHKTYTTTDVLHELCIQYYVLDYLVRSGQISPISEGRGRGRERRFTQGEMEKVKNLTRWKRPNSGSDK